MMDVKEPNYSETLSVMRGASELPPVYADLKEYIESTHAICVVNFVLDEIQGNRPRLRVLLLDDVKRMMDGYNYEKEKQVDIAEAFLRLKERHGFLPERSLENLFVCYSDFRMDIQSEVAGKACIDAIPAIERQMCWRAKIWKMDKVFTSLYVFYETVAQVDKYADNGVSVKITETYAKYIHVYDEFGVFQNGPTIIFDSKENVDKNYQGNLFYYFR